MNKNDSILPVVIGLTLSLSLHLAGAIGWAYSQQSQLQPPVDPRPDLIAVDFTVSDWRIIGQPALVTMTFRNEHQPVTEPFTVNLQIDQSKHAFHIAPPIAAGQVIERTFLYSADTPGMHTLTMTIDSDRAIDDRDRSNNVIEKQFDWQPKPAENQPEAAPRIVDLAVLSMDVPEPRIAGRPARVIFEITNQGPDPCPPCSAAILVDDTAVAGVNFDTLAPGEKREIETAITVKEPGEYTITLFADPTNAQRETDETNNEISGVFEWKAGQQIGGERDDAVVNMISYDEYEKQLQTLRKRDFDQPLAQMLTDPTPNAPDQIVDPTPPAPRSRPTPAQLPQTLAMRPQAQPTEPQPESSDTQATEQPLDQLTDPSPLDPAKAPALSSAADQATAPDQNPTVEPTLIEPTDPQGDRPALAIRQSPADDPTFDKSPFEPMNIDRDIVRESFPALSNPGDVSDLLEPHPLDQPGQMRIDAPLLAVDPDAAPPDRTLAMDATAINDPKLPSLPVELDDNNPMTGSPTDKPTDQPPAPKDHQPEKTQQQPADQTQTKPKPAQQQQPQRNPQVNPRQNPSPPSPKSDANPTSAPREEMESPTVSIVKGAIVKPGKVLTMHGLKIRTVAPRLSQVAKRTTAPRDMIVRLTFDTTGHVIDADILRSSDYASVDSAILTSLFKWTLEGEIKSRFILDELHLILGVIAE